MEISDGLSIIAVLIAPIIAVWVGQGLQDRAQKRQDKMQIFKILMASRASWSYDAVVALNIIEVVFADEEDVVSQWKKYYDKLCVEHPTSTDLKKIQDEKNKLLEIIAHSLGYKKQIRWETIENPYIPIGMIDEMNKLHQMKDSQQAITDKLMNMILSNEKVEDKTIKE